MNTIIKSFDNKTIPELRLNAICPYFTMFPLSFPYQVLKDANKRDIVLDPFCGRGTTNYAARLRGLDSYGIDSNPVAKAIAEVKFFRVEPTEILSTAASILYGTDDKNIPEGDFWNWAYHKKTLRQISIFREYFLNKANLTNTEKALKAIILGILHGPIMKTEFSYLSNQMPRTFSTKPDYSVKYWKKYKLRPEYVDSLQLIYKKADYTFNSSLPQPVKGKIILGDSRDCKTYKDSKKCNWVITSPPYYGMHSYEQDQWLRNWFLGGEETVNYSVQKQIKHHSEKSFLKDLSAVWKNVSRVCDSNTKLIVRFGSLPSMSEKTPSELLKESLYKSDCGWKIVTIKNAGKPSDSNRQANQFKNDTGKYVEEIDLFAILKN
jgi:hypothetical protein